MGKHIYNPSAKETIQAASAPNANEGAKGSLGLQRLTEAGAGGDKTITTQTAEKAEGVKKSAAELVRAQIAALEKEAAEKKSAEKPTVKKAVKKQKEEKEKTTMNKTATVGAVRPGLEKIVSEKGEAE